MKYSLRSLRPKRSWFQFSLQGLIFLILAIGIGLGWWNYHRNAEIRRQARIDKAVQLLGECPSPLGFNYNPVPLIRAVNHLHSMGKDDAIKALRRVEAEGPFTRAEESLALVIPLLFGPKEPEDKLPAPSRTGGYTLKWDQWDNWIDVEGDVPFHTVMTQANGGLIEPVSYLVDWAEQDGRMRTTPLRPTDDLIGAANTLVERLDGKSKSDDEAWSMTYHVRGQVYAAIKHLFPEQERRKLGST